MNNLIKIGLGGGCHWCTEAIFLSLKGVIKVQQGWISSKTPHESFSEAVIVTLNTTVITLKDLITIHLYTHNSTSNHSMREKYRSAVYYFSSDDEKLVRTILNDVQTEFNSKIITETLPFSSFKPSLGKHQNYYYKNPEKPFCQTYIDPKLSFLLKKFSNHLK